MSDQKSVKPSSHRWQVQSDHAMTAYPERWLVKLVEAILVLGIIIFGMNTLNGLLRQTMPAYKPDVHQIRPDYDSPMSAHSYYWSGRQAISEADYVAGFRYLNSALAMDADYALAYLSRGILYERREYYQAAGADFWQYINRYMIDRVDETPITVDSAAITLSLEPGRVYHVPFRADAGQILTVQAQSVDADPIVVILDTFDQPVVGSDDSYHRDPAVLYDDFASLTATIPATPIHNSGMYDLVVSHAGGGSTGTVTVTLTLASARD